MGADQTVSATVMEELPRGMYRVKLEKGQEVLAHPAAGTTRNFVRLLPGDRVEVALAPRDFIRARIVKKV